MNSTIYKQYDSRWGSKPYPTKNSSFAGNGCGCVACTHLLIERVKYKNYTPETVRKYMVSQGFAVSGKGTTWAGITKTLEHYGYQVTHIGEKDPMSKAWKELDKGNRIGIILFLGGSGPDGTVWTAGGHYVAFTSYKKTSDGKHKMYMKDSGARNHDGWYYYEKSMKGRVYQMWIVENKDAMSSVEEDNLLSKSDVKAAQKLFGTTVDGVISNQLTTTSKYWPGIDLDCIDFGKGGSEFVKKLQKFLKLSGPDGYLGPNTIKALQKLLGITADGVWGIYTTKAFNNWVKSQTTLKTENEKEKSSNTVKLKGIDISAYQKSLSKAKFTKMKNNGIKFVILRIGYTGSESKKPTIDSVFENNYKNAKAAGLPIGIYYYSLATTEAKAKEEADFVVSYLKGKEITYPVYIDIEDSKQINCKKSELQKVANTFCKIVKTAGYMAGVYASLSWWNDKIGTVKESQSTWVAQYNSTCDYKNKYDIWQYTSKGNVVGISGNVDMDYCYKKF